MAALQDRALAVLEDLIELGNQVLDTKHTTQYSGDVVESGIHAQWMTRCSAYIERIFGRETEYFRRLSSGNMTDSYVYSARFLYNHLLAIKADIESGAIFQAQLVVEAEVFDDLLEQAEHLRKTGYYAPAAVVAGCVLEDSIRRIGQHHGIVWPRNPKLDSMNAELAKAGVYQKLTQKKVTALADIRNSAAHGKWGDFTAEDVEAMLRDIRDFVTKHFT